MAVSLVSVFPKRTNLIHGRENPLSITRSLYLQNENAVVICLTDGSIILYSMQTDPYSLFNSLYICCSLLEPSNELLVLDSVTLEREIQPILQGFCLFRIFIQTSRWVRQVAIFLDELDFQLLFSVHRHSMAVIDFFQSQNLIVSVDRHRNFSIIDMLNHSTCAIISGPQNDNFVSVCSDKSNPEIIYFVTEMHCIYEYQVTDHKVIRVRTFLYSAYIPIQSPMALETADCTPSTRWHLFLIASIANPERAMCKRRVQSEFISESTDLELVLNLDLNLPMSIHCILSFLSIWHFWDLDEASDQFLMQMGFSADYSKAACLQGKDKSSYAHMSPYSISHSLLIVLAIIFKLENVLDFTDACSGKESRDKSFSLGHKKRGNYIPIILGICAKYHPELHPKLSTPRMIGALCQSLLELASVSLKGNCLAPLTALDIIGDGLDVFFPFINISKLIHVLFSQFSPKHSEVLYKIFHKLFSPGMIETHSELVKIFIHDHLSSRSIASFQATISFLLQMLSKSPVSLSAALPYFIDAIMKLLDPSFMEIREKVLPLCSKFLYACFKTYPFIDFHSEKQKYAVANDRGPIVIYDLKTGTKSFVLESSICARASVISLSPDANHVCALTNRVSAANMEKPKTAHSSYRSSMLLAAHLPQMPKEEIILRRCS
ncbi:hypothetical protein DI09_31p30 [Mitosporidium daphniae]|uniref:Uncharacterized protein n=1 Tax=Mitosporidium daphniae TaxID=1485682 RepID=A0A098VR96_9MICR|nr:uncharacterized protein DI09_31p30 [Mitosporidium daphniae]KGG51552.1 hypothetical protein DI09_31p30 [Mitosporidium daphniae]|eukprot:XP_013238005.1 uncharacterized protein DI09_31p30 [Mitosporidium daphniae]